MHLSCPYCTTIFDVSASELGTMGRQVQCGVCEHEWFVKAEFYEDLIAEGEEAKLNPFLDDENLPTDGVPDVTSALSIDDLPLGGMPSLVSSHKMQSRHNLGKKILISTCWTLLCICTFLILFYATIKRDDIVAQFPALSKLYRVARLDVDYQSNIRIFQVKGTHLSVQFRNKERILNIKGMIVNIGDIPALIPTLRLSLNDIHGKEGYTSRIKMPNEPIRPNEAHHFEHTIFQFPDNALSIVLVFLNHSEDLYNTINLTSE